MTKVPKILLLTLVCVFISLLLLLSVTAEGMEVSKKDTRRNVFPGTDGIFEITIKNTRAVEDTFSVNYDALNFYPFSDVLDYVIAEPSKVTLKPQEEGKIVVKVRTLKTAKQKRNYKLTVWVKSQTEKEIQEEINLYLNVLPSENLVSVEPLFAKEIAPGQNKVFRFNLKNNIDIPFDASVYVSSELFEGNQKVRFEANESTMAEFIFNLDSSAKIRDYPFRVTIYLDQDLIGSFSDTIFVTPNPDIRETRDLQESFLKSILVITKENIGNSPLKIETSVSVTMFEKLFSSFSPKPDSIKKADKLYVVVWEHTISPGEKYTVTIKKNYAALFAFASLLLVSIFILAYWLLRPVVVKKSVSMRRDKLVVHLNVQNRSGFMMSDVEIIDIIPPLLELTGQYGTLEPKKIQTAMHGKKIVWEVKHINAHEELLLSYETSQKLKIHGSIRLPPSLVSYKTKRDRIIRLKSNLAVLERKIPSELVK